MQNDSELHHDGSNIDFALGFLMGFLLGLLSAVFLYLSVLLIFNY